MDRESQLLEAEAERSNSRLKQMKWVGWDSGSNCNLMLSGRSANKKMSATRMQLHSGIKETEAKSLRCLEHLDEMEIKVARLDRVRP